MVENNPDSLFTLWVGNVCREISRNEHDWMFQIGEVGALVVWCPWRIIADGGIAHAGEDDGQKFGLPKPVEGVERATSLLFARKIVSVEVAPISSDLRIRFEDDRILELFNNSSGYEGWHATIKRGHESTSVIAQGGGQISILIS
jgi:hypothetical protein